MQLDIYFNSTMKLIKNLKCPNPGYEPMLCLVSFYRTLWEDISVYIQAAILFIVSICFYCFTEAVVSVVTVH